MLEVLSWSLRQFEGSGNWFMKCVLSYGLVQSDRLIIYCQAFLLGHIVGAILWIVGCYYHVYYLDPNCGSAFIAL